MAVSTDEEIRAVTRRVLSAQHIQIKAAAQAWLLLSQAANDEDVELQEVSGDAEASPGVGLIELAQRVDDNSAWVQGAGGLAGQVHEQLSNAAESASVAVERAMRVDMRLDGVNEDHADTAGEVTGTFASEVGRMVEEQKQELLNEALEVQSELSNAYAQVIAGEPPPPPGGGGGGMGPSGVGGSPGGVAGGAMPAAAAAAAPADFQAPNGAAIGAGSYPHSSVMGPGHGDFAGWVESPTTGFLTDPATGREFDPVTGRWIDPVTGQPFGEVTDYASRYAGIGTGPGAIAGGAAALGAGAGMAGMYGGMMPPSIGNTGPARGQMMNQAARNLGQRAGVAQRFAMHEAGQQGGRPFMPPPGANHGRAGTGGARPAGAAGARSGAPVAGGARGFMPPPGANHGRTGQAASGARGAGAQGAANGAARATGTAAGRAMAPPPVNSTRPVPAGTTGQRAAAAARHQLAGKTTSPPAPAPGANGARGGQQRATSTKKQGGQTGEQELWVSTRSAGRGVIGD